MGLTQSASQGYTHCCEKLSNERLAPALQIYLLKYIVKVKDGTRETKRGNILLKFASRSALLLLVKQRSSISHTGEALEHPSGIKQQVSLFGENPLGK